MEEEWRDVVGYEGLYQVSNFGRVKKLARKHIYTNGDVHFYPERFLYRNPNGNVYTSVRLVDKDFHSIQRGIHRLVAEAFIPNPKNKSDVNHIDGNKHNNRADNLEWATRTENMEHCREVLHKEPKKVKIKCIETGETFESLAEASIKTGARISKLSQVVHGQRHTTAGYHWTKAN